MVTHPMFARTLIALAALTLASHASAEVYTWKDANGRVQFSDQPPPGAEVKPTKPAPGPKYAPAPVAPSNSKSSAVGAKPAAGAQSEPKTEASAPAAQSGPKSWQDKDLEYKQRRAAEQEAETKRKQEEAKADEKKRYCEGLRNNLTMLEKGGRVTTTNAQGERTFLDDNQMKQDAERTRGQLARDCK